MNDNSFACMKTLSEHADASCKYFFQAQNVKKNFASDAAVSQGHILFVFEIWRRKEKKLSFTKKNTKAH